MRTGAAAIAVVSLAASPVASRRGESAVPVVVGTVATYDVRQGDSLGSVSARAGVDVAVLVEENGLRGDAPLRPGQWLRVDNRHIVPERARSGVVMVYGRLAAASGALARRLANERGLADRIDWTVADAVLAARHGIARDVSKQETAP